MSASASSPTSAASTGAGPALAPNWKATKDANGQVYYYNRITRETRWDLPLAQPNPTTGAPIPLPIQALAHNTPTPVSAAAVASPAAVQTTALSLSRHQSVEGSPSLSRANPSITERVATLSRSSGSQSQSDSAAPSGGGTALPPPPPDLPEAGTARKRVADLAQAFAQKTSTSTPPGGPAGSKATGGAQRKWGGSNNQLSDSGKRGSVYSSFPEINSNDTATTISNAPASHADVPPSSKPTSSAHASDSSAAAEQAPPTPPATADPPQPQLSPVPAPLSGEIDLPLPLPPPPPPLDWAPGPVPAPLPTPSAKQPIATGPCAPLPPTTSADSASTAALPHHHAPHPRTYSVSHVESSAAAHSASTSGAAAAPSQMHPRSMTISAGSSPSRVPTFPLAAIETTLENEDDRPLQRSKPPSPKKLRESTMSGFLVDLDKKLANSQGNLIVAASQAAASASQTEHDSDAAALANRASGVPSLSIAPPSATGSSTPGSSTLGGQSPAASPISPSTSTHSNELSSSPGENGESVGAAKEGGLGGLLRRARSPSFSKPNKKEKSSKDKSKHPSPTEDSSDHLSLSQPESPNLQARSPTSLVDNTKSEKARPKSLVLNSLGIGTASSTSSSASSSDHPHSAASTHSLSSSNPSIPGSASTPNNSPASGTNAASSSGGKGALSWLFKKSDKSSSISGSPHTSPASPDTAANVFGGSLSVLGASGVPPLVTLCIAIVEERGPRIEGIYRLSGNAAAIQRYKAAWQTAAATPGSPLPDVSAFDVNVVSGTLKSFLRELQDPVLTCDMYPEWVLAGKMDPGPTRAEVIRGLIARLPHAHQEVLRVLMWHLHWLSKFADHTKMDPSNLAIVFGPTLVRPRVESMETMVNTEPQNAVVAEMIANVGDYFEPLEAERETDVEPGSVPTSPTRVVGEGAEEPRSSTGKFRPPKGAMLVMPHSPVGLPPKLPDLQPISPIDTPVNGSREANGTSGIGI